jgi:Icc-related predicted phosphoesterase
MRPCFFVSDLHGRTDRYRKLFEAIEAERPSAVFLGGDLLPSGLVAMASIDPAHRDFVGGVLGAGFQALRDRLGADSPRVFLILGNDDPRFEEAAILEGATRGLWDYVHDRRVEWNGFQVHGYACVPPTPFMLKDWERYDVSRYVDPGCTSPEEGCRTWPASTSDVRYGTIREDLDRLAGDAALDRAIFLFHAPPYQTGLDRAALDGVMVDYVQVDVHVGSIAVRRFIEARQPLVTLHGHVHESLRLTSCWRERIGRTVAVSAAHDGAELALVRFDPEHANEATRDLL